MLSNFLNNIIIHFADKNVPLKGELCEQGYCVVNGAVPTENLGPISQAIEETPIIFDPLYRFSTVADLLFNDRIIKIVQDYLGPKVTLDYCWARHLAVDAPKSDTWHHDSVGHRVKAFLCLSDQDESAHTKIVVASHKEKYTDYSKSRIDDSQIPGERIASLIGKKGDLIIFDTNGLHKGVYGRSRDIVQFEFSHPYKSYMRGHVGRRFTVIGELAAQSPLIDRKKISYDSGFVGYR